MSLTFHMKGKTEVSVEYKDKLPKGMTAEEFKAVSYTHLTLPTILLV